MTTNNIAVARLWYRKGKEEYFSIKQLLHFFPEIQFDFHVVLSEPNHQDEWSTKIDNLNLNITYYSKEDMDSYFIKAYPSMSKLSKSFCNFVHFCHILIGHYLRRVHLYEYMLTYEYDIIFNEDTLELREVIKNKIPFGIIEPQNNNCDKALINSLCNLYQANLLERISINNPSLFGINAGFQGVNLRLFDDFLSASNLEPLMKIFDFGGIYKENGEEKWGIERTIFDTQEQSFYSIMNQVYSENFVVMDPAKYYFWPCWEDFEGYVDHAMKSKVIHFTGHKKASKLFELINEGIKKF